MPSNSPEYMRKYYKENKEKFMPLCTSCEETRTKKTVQGHPVCEECAKHMLCQFCEKRVYVCKIPYFSKEDKGGKRWKMRSMRFCDRCSVNEREIVETMGFNFDTVLRSRKLEKTGERWKCGVQVKEGQYLVMYQQPVESTTSVRSVRCVRSRSRGSY